MSLKTILYVENDLVSQTMYQKRLECEGYHVECARDGQVALDILSERVPDLVLLDLMLPKVSGADVLNFMHADPRLTTVPVIIFSNAPMTEVPPDSAAAQGAKRLLKSDCTFPTLLGTIQESLAHPPELVVMEAGRTSPTPPAASSNGEHQPNGSAIDKLEPEAEISILKKGAEFLEEAAAMMPKIREHSMGYIKAPDSEGGKAHLSGLHQRVHLLNSSIAQSGCPRVALLTNALDALLAGISEKPSTVTPSVLQTIAQAVDCLDGLLKNADGYSVGPAFQAKVLVVDDDTVCNHVSVTSLKRAGFDPVGVKDPAAALEYLQSTSFDLVVLDINMPGMTGFDVCAKMRRLPQCNKIPVIFVTAFGNFDNRKQSVLSGGNDFVSKPVSPLELALKVTVNLIKARVQGVQPPQSDTSSVAKNGSVKSQPPEPPAKLTAAVEHGSKDAKPAVPIRQTRPGAEPQPDRVPEPALRAKMSTPVNPPAGGKTPEADIHDRLHQSTAALERAKAGLEREAAERMRLESQWREQLGAAETLVKQTEKIIKEKDARCSQLEKELARLQQVRDELQNKFAAEQQTVAKAQQECKELKTNLDKLSAERTRLETEWREQLNAAKAAAIQKETVLKEKETRCGQLEKELAGLQQAQNELQNKFTSEQQAAAKSQQAAKELQERLNHINTELERSQASFKQQSAERTRLETEWREQLNAAKAATTQKETVLKDKETRCGQLEKELAGLKQSRDELQTKFAAELQTVAKAQQESKELKINLDKLSAERAHLETEWREQLNAAKAAAIQKETVLKEKETRCGQLEKELAGLQQAQNELQNKFTGEQQAAAKSQQAAKELQERLNHINTELERSQASFKQQSAERTRLETEWREQLNAVKAAAVQKETVLKERETRCGQLEKELVGLQQAQNELQNKFTSEQQTAAKSQQAAREFQERLNQANTELGRSQAALKQQSEERARLETEWREQSNAAKTAIAQAEKALAEKTGRCGQLETKLVDLQQEQDEFQNKLAAEQDRFAKSQKEIKELQERLQQSGAELEHARATCEQESAKRAHWESECQNLSKAGETLNLELHELRESRAAYEAGVQEKQRKLAESLRENIQLLQLRLQEAESLNGDSETASRAKPRSH